MPFKNIMIIKWFLRINIYEKIILNSTSNLSMKYYGLFLTFYMNLQVWSQAKNFGSGSSKMLRLYRLCLRFDDGETNFSNKYSKANICFYAQTTWKGFLKRLKDISQNRKRWNCKGMQKQIFHYTVALHSSQVG
jgi:hypothetical protein